MKEPGNPLADAFTRSKEQLLSSPPDPVTEQAWAEDLKLLDTYRGRYISFHDQVDESGKLTRTVLADSDNWLEIHRLRKATLAGKEIANTETSRVITRFIE